jgi:methylenetetrahydrofolate reductase (NADPH)
MTIRDLLNASAPTLSYELFPPRSDASAEALWKTIALLAETNPDFASITYGASGATRHSSRGVVQRLAIEHTIPPLAHLTCVDQSRAEVTGVIEEFMAEGVRDFLALRGDPPDGEPNWRQHPDGLMYAYQLVELIREVARTHGNDNVSVGVTAFPAAHASEQWRQQGLDVLKAKQDAGADFAVTQVFYDAEQWRALDRDAKAEGIGLPILPGIIPLLNAARANRLAQLTGVAAPAALVTALDTAADASVARVVGVTAAADLANELLESGAPGVHVYTFNKHEAALALVERLALGR